MSVSTNLKGQVDLPVWEQMRFFPAATPALSCMSASKIAGDRYMFALSASTLWRYDTYKDTWMQLASPPVAPLTVLSMEYIANGKYYGKNIRSLNSTQMLVAGFPGNRFVGKTIQIVSGTGPGQSRTIISETEPIIYERGVATAVSNVLPISITDSAQKWDINQWTGYHCKLVFGAGASQYRKILYNDATNLYFGDINWQQLFPAGDGGWNSIAPNAVPVSTAGLQTHYHIEAQTITVSAPWSTTPDDQSIFAILGGVLAVVSSAAALPFYTLQAYDILSDTWTNRSAIAGPIMSGAIGTDISVANTYSSSAVPLVVGGLAYGGTITSTARTLSDSSKTGGTAWADDQWTNYRITIIAGTGAGMTKRIIGNRGGYLEVHKPWEVNPDGTSYYTIDPDQDVFWCSGMGQASLIGYSVYADQEFQGSMYDYGLARVLAVKPAGFESIGVSTGVRGTNGITAVNATPTAGGLNYLVGDVLTMATGGTNGKVIVTGTTTGGAVLTVALQACGTGYGVSAGQATTGGSGNGACTIEVTSVGTVALVTTAINHAFKTGDSCQFSGDALWVAGGTYGLGYYSIIAVPSLTTIQFALTAAGNAVADFALSTALFVDCAANWTVNEHVGKIIMLSAPGSTGAATTRRITANTKTTITYQTVTALAVNGTYRYSIQDVKCFGKAKQYKVSTLDGAGYATGGTSGSLIDSTKNWMGNQWAGYKLRVLAGTGLAFNDITIVSNTPTTLTLSAPGFTPDTTTKYIIMSTFGLLTTVGNVTNAVLTDTTKNWTTNQWAGKIVRINSGTGQGFEKTITSNTTNALTLSGVYVTPPLANESTYCILDIPARSTGHRLLFLEKYSVAPGRYMASLRGGGSNTGDIYDIASELWNITYASLPQGESYTTGSMMCYDGASAFYLHANATGRIYKFNLITGELESAGTMPYGHGVAVIGSRMEIVTTTDGLKYLYILRHTGAAAGTEMFRMLIY